MSSPKLAIIAGGRDYSDFDRVCEIVEEEKLTFIIEGGAKGADLLGKNVAITLGIDFIEVPALWGAYGKSAGMRRNRLMAKLLVKLAGLDTEKLLIAFPGGTGTAGMVKEAEAQGIRVRKVDWA